MTEAVCFEDKKMTQNSLLHLVKIAHWKSECRSDVSFPRLHEELAPQGADYAEAVLPRRKCTMSEITAKMSRM